MRRISACLALLAASAGAYGQIEVYHKTAYVEIGTTRQFSTYVPLSPSTVVWSVNGINGGNSTVGTVTQSGLYQAPATAPTPSLVKLRATSTAYPDKFGEADIYITRKTPWIWSINPQPLPTGNFTLSINGANLTPDAQVSMDGAPLQTLYISSTSLKASGNKPSAGTAKITVYLPGPGEVTSQAFTVTFTVQTPVVSCTVTPSSASINTGATQSFAVTVANTASQAVTWNVNTIPGGNATVGTITAAGVYTAPAAPPSPATVTVSAIPAADTTKSCTASATIQQPPVTVTPASAAVQTGARVAFTASTPSSWRVNGISEGNTTVGTITAQGVYTAPAVVPNPSAVTVSAVSNANPQAIGTATVTIQAPAVTITPASATVSINSTAPFSANVPVTWRVNGVPGGNAVAGTISASGVYTAPSVVPSPAVVTVSAVNQADPSAIATAAVTIQGPPPAATLISAGRLLEQAGFGPRPADIQKVQQVGVTAYIDEQLAMPEVPVPDQPSTGALRAWTFHNYTHAPDQLRQRVAYALGQITVTSLNKWIYPNEILPWMRLLNKHALGNYRQLLRDVTVSPSMGKFLDLANSRKAGGGSAANENYPRELLQLFSIGLWELNNDGSQNLDASAKPISTYTQATVQQVAAALTGWTYPTKPGSQPSATNQEYFVGEMEPRESNHDTSAKSFLGCNLPAGQTVQQDTDATLDCVFNHPNTPPFVSIRLIRSLVKSNPTPGYVSRISAVFINNGQGVRGDLKAVVRAILLDPEARAETPDASSGRLKEPLYHLPAMIRAMNGNLSATNAIAYMFDNMAQSVLTPPSVFSWYSPMYRVPNAPLFGPEFQIYTPTHATLRANMFYQILSSQITNDVTVDMTPFTAVAGNASQLLNEVDRVFFHGRMDSGVRQAIMGAVNAAPDNNQRVQAALYLAILSGQYAVQY